VHSNTKGSIRLYSKGNVQRLFHKGLERLLERKVFSFLVGLNPLFGGGGRARRSLPPLRKLLKPIKPSPKGHWVQEGKAGDSIFRKDMIVWRDVFQGAENRRENARQLRGGGEM